MIHFYFNNILLKNMEEDIPISITLLETPKLKFASALRIWTISKTEKFIEKTYDESVKSELKRKVLLELQNTFSAEEKENEHLEEFVQSFYDQISTLKSEVNFLQE